MARDFKHGGSHAKFFEKKVLVSRRDDLVDGTGRFSAWSERVRLVLLLP
jgi:hypothetical protein